VPEKDSAKVHEPRNSVIGKSWGLIAFLAHDANTYVRFLNHCDVINTISNSECAFSVRPLTHELNNLSFLVRRRAE
jgi:hypothetical protein